MTGRIPERIALVAGTGRLPGHLVRVATGQGFEIEVWTPRGTEPELPSYRTFEIVDFPSLLARFRSHGPGALCFAGPVAGIGAADRCRGTAAPFRLPALLRRAFAQPDAAATRALADCVQGYGLELLGPHEIDHRLVALPGHVAGPPPGPAQLAQARRGAQILATPGDPRIGQAVVLGGERPIILEDRLGTDALLSGLRPGQGGILVKRPATDQDKRIDTPVIGPRTIELSVAAGLTGVAIAAGGTLILDRAEATICADRIGLSLWAER